MNLLCNKDVLWGQPFAKFALCPAWAASEKVKDTTQSFNGCWNSNVPLSSLCVFGQGTSAGIVVIIMVSWH